MIMHTENYKKYYWIMAAMIVIGIPFVAQVSFLAAGFLSAWVSSFYSNEIVNWLIFIVISQGLFGVGSFFLIQKIFKNLKKPTRQSRLYLPVLLPIFYVLIAWNIAFFRATGNFASSEMSLFVSATLPFLFLHIVVLFSAKFWLSFAGVLVPYCVFFLIFFKQTRQAGIKESSPKSMVIMGSFLLVLFGVTAFQNSVWRSHIVTQSSSFQPIVEDINVDEYRPFYSYNNLVKFQSSLAIDTDYPRLDGATAAYPLYAAAVESIYKKIDESTISEYVQCNRTPDAYTRLLEGKVDMIFAAAPSKEQQAQAKAQGIHLKLTPFAKEAFVFLVHPDNPVKTLTLEQIQAIYAGDINNWREVGGDNEKILAFQRPENSGSQSIMQSKVMGDRVMRPVLEGEYARGMGGIIRRIADYNNAKQALGYSFRYYATVMNAAAQEYKTKRNATTQYADQVRLLAINGIEPTIQQIQNNQYPFTVPVYMVTRDQPSQNTQKLMDWFLGPEGQKLVQQVGYVPL